MKRLSFAKKAFGLAAIGLATGCAAAPQTVPSLVPPAPFAATPTPANMAGVAPGGAPPGPVTVWQKLGLGKQQLEFCRRRMCESPVGMLMGRAIAPMSALSGGLIPPFCSPVPTIGELLDPGVVGASSKVKADKLNAEKRKKAVEELAGVDCHYWPEAEKALIAALREDRNECVRHTAALALDRGCCCTPNVIDALTNCVSGSSVGGPCEKSPRVRAAAAIALEHCLERACCPECPIPEGAVPVPDEKKEKKEEGGGGKKEGDKGTDGKSDAPMSWVKKGPFAEDLDEDAALAKARKEHYEKVKKTDMAVLKERGRKALETMPPLPLDLSVPAGHPDYEAAGVQTRVSRDRPANLLDMLNGVQPEKSAKFAPAKPVVASSKPVMVVNTVEPVPAKPIIPVPVPVEPVKTVTPVEPKAPEKINIPLPMPATPKPAAAPVSPLVMPVTAPSTPATKPLPGKAATTSAKVMTMLNEPSDLAELRQAVDMLTAAEAKDAKLVNALLKAAEYPSDPALRVSCLKAVSRGKSKSGEAAASLEKISKDNDPIVAGEAARVLGEMKSR